MGQWVAEGVLFDSLVKANLPGRTKGPNRLFERPALSKNLASTPSWFRTFEVEYAEVQTKTVGRLREVDGYLYFQVWQQGNTDDSLIREDLDRMDAFAEAVTASSNGRLVFFGVIPGDYGHLTEGSTPWYGREARIPFKRLHTPSGEEIGVLAGLSTNSQEFTSETPHGLAVKDFVGPDDPFWRKVRAIEGEPRCEGMVSLVLSETAVVITFGGAVKITGHGWNRGPLYLSQTTAGIAISSEYKTGVSRQVANVYDEDWVIVLGSLPEVAL